MCGLIQEWAFPPSNPEKLEHEVKQIKLDSLQKLDQQRYMYEARLESSKAVNDKTETEQLKERIALLEDIIQEREQVCFGGY